jgi:putative acyl-CoA dehydrogenase
LPIWEGTTNVLALDALRVLRKGETVEALGTELQRIAGPDGSAAVDAVKKVLSDSESAEAQARNLAYTLASTWMAGLLQQAGIEVRPKGIGLRPQ